MKHAVLIAAHRSPTLLAELIEAMATPRAHVFVHVDSAAPFTPNDVVPMLATPARVTMLEPRSIVHWAGYSYLSVVLRLLRAANDAGPFGFYHLLTGQCYPTRKPDEIFDMFEAHPDREYIECFRLPTDRWERGGLNRMEFFHLYDQIDARKRRLGIPVNKGVINGLVAAQRLLRVRRDLPGDFDVYHGGSVFWSLTGECVDYVLGYLDEHPDFEQGLRSTYCPEEILFQTVIATSPLAHRIGGSNLRYIDWTYRNGSMPANLDESDFEKIVESGALFARKVDFQHGTRLREQLRSRAGTGEPFCPE